MAEVVYLFYLIFGYIIHFIRNYSKMRNESGGSKDMNAVLFYCQLD